MSEDLDPETTCESSNHINLDDLLVGELEQILTSMLIVKYPGIEQADLKRLFRAIHEGNVDTIGQVEADMAEKSARWMLAVVDLEQL